MRPTLLAACAATLITVGIAALTAGGGDESHVRMDVVDVEAPRRASGPQPSTHAPDSRAGSRAARGADGLTGDDLPELPPEQEHLAELDLVGAMSDPGAARRVLREQAGGQARADLLRLLADEGWPPEDVAHIDELLAAAAEERRDAAQDALPP